MTETLTPLADALAAEQAAVAAQADRFEYIARQRAEKLAEAEAVLASARTIELVTAQDRLIALAEEYVQTFNAALVLRRDLTTALGVAIDLGGEPSPLPPSLAIRAMADPNLKQALAYLQASTLRAGDL